MPQRRSSWDSTAWLLLRVVIARAIAVVPAGVFASDFTAILLRLGWLGPPVAPPPGHPFTPSTLLGLAAAAAFFIAPLAWVWPIGRLVDTDDEALRQKAVRRFNGINRFFAALIGAQTLYAIAWLPWGRIQPSLAAGVLLQMLAGWWSLYFTLLALEPLLFKDLAQWLYVGDDRFARKPGPAFSVRAKLMLLVGNLVVVPMALVAASMELGLTGWSQGMGVAVLTAVFAVGYIEMLYGGIARPLADLDEDMARVGRGDFGAKAEVLADDEIGRVRGRFNEMVDGLAERDRLKDTFGRFVSIEIAKRLIETKTIALGGESIEATVLFSDIRDFTPLSESLPPQELVAFLNEYFSFVTAPIAEHRGVVNKFIGDAVMAVFAPQFGSKDHAADAVAAALAMRAKLAAFNASRPAARPVRFGVGVHTGPLVAGNIGTDRRMEYTVIGDTVNVAARLESKTKEMGTDILVSDAVHARLDGKLPALAAERCEGVRVKGKDAALVVYKLR